MIADLLVILGLALLTAAAFLVALPLGLLVAGVACLVLALAFADVHPTVPGWIELPLRKLRP